MECKERRASTGQSEPGGINRNIVECKVDRDEKEDREILKVLIETSWNVKLYFSSEYGSSLSCINRNIVECKEI